MSNENDLTRVESLFVRHRNVLMVRAPFCDIFTDHYLHLADHDLRYPPEIDHQLKELYALLTLHAVARPWAETHAWTVNLRAPRVNFFVTASSLSINVTGRAFLEDVREHPQSTLYSQVTQNGEKPRMSTVELETSNPFDWLEHYYRQSEQRPAKVFELPDEVFVLLAAQPDYDEEWFENLDLDQVAQMNDTEDLSPLENRFFKFECGCSLERIVPALGIWRERPEELFQGEPSVEISCPRCAAKYRVTPEDLNS
ncbi:MAG: Hsp33 family molecular chaperone HslO [Verrucomicrobiota bacterium JB023]|nr:Hsp33 family molecular chaperone HslO [Verrucomicrobiota bacterium JB023]